MKQFYLKSVFLCLFTMMGAKAFSYDIAANNADGVTIYYNWINNKTELEVYHSSDKYTGNIVIPKSVTYNDKAYSVTRIGWFAFDDCSGLTSVTIPNSVTRIDDYAFRN